MLSLPEPRTQSPQLPRSFRMLDTHCASHCCNDNTYMLISPRCRYLMHPSTLLRHLPPCTQGPVYSLETGGMPRAGCHHGPNLRPWPDATQTDAAIACATSSSMNYRLDERCPCTCKESLYEMQRLGSISCPRHMAPLGIGAVTNSLLADHR